MSSEKNNNLKASICKHCGYHLKMCKIQTESNIWLIHVHRIIWIDEEPYKGHIKSFERNTPLTKLVQTGLSQLNGTPVTRLGGTTANLKNDMSILNFRNANHNYFERQFDSRKGRKKPPNSAQKGMGISNWNLNKIQIILESTRAQTNGPSLIDNIEDL